MHACGIMQKPSTQVNLVHTRVDGDPHLAFEFTQSEPRGRVIQRNFSLNNT